MAFNGGTIAALVVVSLAVLGICVMYILFETMYAGAAGIKPHDIPLLMVRVPVIGEQRLTRLLDDMFKQLNRESKVLKYNDVVGQIC